MTADRRGFGIASKVIVIEPAHAVGVLIGAAGVLEAGSGAAPAHSSSAVEVWVRSLEMTVIAALA